MSQPCKEEQFESQDVYTRLSFKMHYGINELNLEERERLEDLLIDSYTEMVTRVSDEELLQEASDKGVLL